MNGSGRNIAKRVDEGFGKILVDQELHGALSGGRHDDCPTLPLRGIGKAGANVV